MKKLSILENEFHSGISHRVYEADDQQRPSKTDAGTFKVHDAFNMTMRGWLKTMSGQEEVKDSFFDNGFLVPFSMQAIGENTQGKVSDLQKQLDAEAKCIITEYNNDYSFNIFGTKPEYVSTGWAKNSGGGIDAVVKSIKDNSAQKQDNGGQSNGSGQM